MGLLKLEKFNFGEIELVDTGKKATAWAAYSRQLGTMPTVLHSFIQGRWLLLANWQKKKIISLVLLASGIIRQR